jgi:hypothetical protein
VKTDDPRFEESHKRALERAAKRRALKQAVTDNHPTFERCVRDFLDASNQKHDHLRLKKKIDLCETLRPPQISPAEFKVMCAARELRNELEHDINEAQIQTKMAQLRSAYLAALSPIQAKAEKDLDDASIAASAYQHCISHLVVATDAVQASRKGS